MEILQLSFNEALQFVLHLLVLILIILFLLEVLKIIWHPFLVPPDQGKPIYH